MATRFLIESQYGALFDEQATPAAIRELIAHVMKLGTIFVAEFDERDPRWVQGVEQPGDRVVGMLAIVLIPHPLSGQIIAEEIAWWVEPEARGWMIGPHMLRAAEVWATRKGANMVKMVAPAGSTIGTFYERDGYRAIETAFINTLLR